MDCGNSGSMQSSSGGDEEYDSSRGGAAAGGGGGGGEDSISGFLNDNHQSAGHHFDSINSSAGLRFDSINSSAGLHFDSINASQNPQSLFLFHSHNPPGSSFSPSMPNLSSDFVWPRGLRSDDPAGYGQFVDLVPSSSAAGNVLGPSTGLESDGPQEQQPQPAKNPKKRSRASRRAPTTVLTTDTTNFRQMVQEFTGIPAAPFSPTSTPYSRRLDLGSAMRSSLSAHLDGLPHHYPLRPSAQKSPFFNTVGGMLNSLSPASTMVGANSSTANNLGIITTQPGPDLMKMQNQILPNFQYYPLLQPSSSIKNPLGNDEQVMMNANLESNYKQTCSSSTSEFHPEKGLDNLP